jgi:hypothetical protein
MSVQQVALGSVRPACFHHRMSPTANCTGKVEALPLKTTAEINHEYLIFITAPDQCFQLVNLIFFLTLSKFFKILQFPVLAALFFP